MAGKVRMSRKSGPRRANYIAQLTHKNNHPKLKYLNGTPILHLLPLLASSRFIHVTRLKTRILSGFLRVVRPINWSPGRGESNTDRTTRVSGPRIDYSNMVYFNEWVMPSFNKNPLQISEQGVRQKFHSYCQKQHMINSERKKKIATGVCKHFDVGVYAAVSWTETIRA